MIELIFTGYFMFKFIDLEKDGQINVLLQQQNSQRNLVAWNPKELSYDIREGHIVWLKVIAECQSEKAYETGHFPSGIEYLRARPYICTAKEVIYE